MERMLFNLHAVENLAARSINKFTHKKVHIL